MSAKAERIDELMTKANAALKRAEWFESERLSAAALQTAHSARDFGQMARIALPLLESRRQRVQAAIEVSRSVKIVQGPVPEDVEVEPGCHLLSPPLVGADARRMRLSAIRRDVHALVVCREPTNRLGLVPIVAVGETVLRTRIDPPKNPAKPERAWFLAALEQLGDAAIASLDTGMEIERQVSVVMAMLDAHPDHEKLHQLLADLCARAEKELAGRPPKPLPLTDLDDVLGVEDEIGLLDDDGSSGESDEDDLGTRKPGRARP
jgi:hypothetical protein